MSGASDIAVGFNPEDRRPLTRVAVAIIERVEAGERQVLFAQRPEGKAYAGYWEFPGGKIEPGETVEQAAIREIEEELGLTIEAAPLWRQETFSYEHAHVELNFCRITRWRGVPQGREGQAFAWQPPRRITLSPLLPALLHEQSFILDGLKDAV